MASDPNRRWVTVSELAEYEYCPRAWWYREHPPSTGPARDSVARSIAGEEFHRRALQRTRSRDRSAGGWLALAVASAVAVAILFLVLLRP